MSWIGSQYRWFNPYKPGVPFLGHRQTVQTQIRRRRTGSILFAHRNFYQKYDKNEKRYTRHPLNEKWSRPIDKDGKSIRQMWVNRLPRRTEPENDKTNKMTFALCDSADSDQSGKTFFRWDLVMKIFLRPFTLFRWFKKGSCQLLTKEWALSTGKLPRRLAQEQCG